MRTRVTAEQKSLWEAAAGVERRSLSDWMRLVLDERAAGVLGEVPGEERRDATGQEETSSTMVSVGAPGVSPSALVEPEEEASTTSLGRPGRVGDGAGRAIGGSSPSAVPSGSTSASRCRAGTARGTKCAFCGKVH